MSKKKQKSVTQKRASAARKVAGRKNARAGAAKATERDRARVAKKVAGRKPRTAAATRKPKALSSRTCVPCRGGVPPLRGSQIAQLEKLLDGWGIVDNHHLHKSYPFGNFAEALDFGNRVGEVAEAEGHHPDLLVAWGKVEISIWTHKIDGLTESDFILAAKCDEVFASL